MNRDALKKIKKCLSFSLAVAIAGCGGGSADAPVTSALQSTPVASACKVALYGDSITSGFYTDITTTPYTATRLAEPMAAALRRLLPGAVIDDRSVPGQSMRNLVEGFTHPDPQWGYVPPFNLQNRNGADVVVGGSGVIDAWLTDINGEWSIAESVDYFQRWESIAKQVAREGARLVITGLARQHIFPAGPQQFISAGMVRERDNFDAAARRAADYLGVPFADIGSVRFDGAADILDTVHPSPAYSGRMVERIALSVESACQAAGRRTR